MKYLLIISLSLLSLYSVADTDMRDKTIKNLLVNSTTGIHFQLNESMANNEGCSSNSWFKIESDSKYEKEAYAFLLSAEAQNKSINFVLGSCTGNYPKVMYVY